MSNGKGQDECENIKGLIRNTMSSIKEGKTIQCPNEKDKKSVKILKG